MENEKQTGQPGQNGRKNRKKKTKQREKILGQHRTITYNGNVHTTTREDLYIVRGIEKTLGEIFDGREEVSDEMCRVLKRILKMILIMLDRSKRKVKERAEQREKERKNALRTKKREEL